MRKFFRDRRGTFLFRSRPVTAVSVMVAGAALLALGLPADWIDLAALAIAVVSVRPADTNRPSPAVPRLRKKNRIAKRRIPRGTT
ncbi:hypothetical protein ACIO1C_13295 [Streptomyces sp. NPDC087420]|uniref:hypothetical protein n=1 Tax=Streptomyces sp. NPDC087420 TaxID=3365785 RepID=UPI0038384831